MTPDEILEEAARIRRAELMLSAEKVGPFVVMADRLRRALIGPDEIIHFVVPKEWEPQGVESIFGHKVIYTDVTRPGVMIQVDSH